MQRYIVYIFFFSSRRRHTRLVSDWSSDVCSSDLFPPVQVFCAMFCNWLAQVCTSAVVCSDSALEQIASFLGGAHPSGRRRLASGEQHHPRDPEQSEDELTEANGIDAAEQRRTGQRPRDSRQREANGQAPHLPRQQPRPPV